MNLLSMVSTEKLYRMLDEVDPDSQRAEDIMREIDRREALANQDVLSEVAADLLPIGEDWGGYPAPHYDEDDCCMCPDHKAMRRERSWN
jgi:hypothetical protein